MYRTIRFPLRLFRGVIIGVFLSVTLFSGAFFIFAIFCEEGFRLFCSFLFNTGLLFCELWSKWFVIRIESSLKAVSCMEGGNLTDFRLAIGTSESESLSLGFVFWRLDYCESVIVFECIDNKDKIRIQ